MMFVTVSEMKEIARLLGVENFTDEDIAYAVNEYNRQQLPSLTLEVEEGLRLIFEEDSVDKL